MGTKSNAKKTRRAPAQSYTPTVEAGRYIIMWALKSAPGAERFLREAQSDVIVRLIGTTTDGETGQISITLPARQALTILDAPFNLAEIETEARRRWPFTAAPIVMLSASSASNHGPDVTVVQQQ